MKSEKEKMIAGELYLAYDQELVNDRFNAKQLLRKLNVDEYVVSEKSNALLKQLIPNSLTNLYIEPPFHCDYGYNIYCGENVYFNVNCVVLDTMPVKIGSNVFFGPGAHIYAASHPLNAIARRTEEFSKPVIIGDDCWIGGGAIICPGVTIGDRCVIGAGAVVTKDIPDDSLAFGNPAKVIRKL
ncbi:Maltose O-acetyltransferase [compost metagenome]